MAAAGGLVSSKLLRLQGAGVGALAGFFSAAAVASASASASGGGDGSNACPAYPWPPQDGARGGAKVFMQHDCAACHSMLPYAGAGAGLAAAGAGEVGATAAEIVVVHEVAQPEPAAAAAAAPHGGACPPDLSVVAKMLEGLRRRSNLYNADELKRTMALPTPVWLQFLQPYYSRNPQAA